jgi:type IV pilus assembly protein PilV
MNKRLSPAFRRASPQAGFMLLEVLVALVIFAFGVMALIGLQTRSIRQAAAAEYRSTAEFAANDLVSRMWMTDRSYATLSSNFETGAATGYAAWWSAWQPLLPGTSAKTLAPTVTITSQDGGGTAPVPGSLVTIAIQWKAPADGDTAHRYALEAQIK